MHVHPMRPTDFYLHFVHPVRPMRPMCPMRPMRPTNFYSRFVHPMCPMRSMRPMRPMRPMRSTFHAFKGVQWVQGSYIHVSCIPCVLVAGVISGCDMFFCCVLSDRIAYTYVLVVAPQQ